MQANARLVNQGELEKRKEKERKREEKELRKLAKAQGIKIAKPAAAAPPPVLALESDTRSTNETKPSGFKKVGWAAVTTAPKPPDIDSGCSGWAAVSTAPSTPDEPIIAAPPASRSLPASGAPVFRAGGWTSLDPSSSQSVISPPSPPEPLAPPPPPPAHAPPTPPSNRHQLPAGASVPFHPAGQSWATIPDSHPSPQPHPPTSLHVAAPPPPVAHTRSGWQQWKQGSSSKRR